MIERLVVDVALDRVHDLAEGPVWDPAGRRLLWVDINRGTVFTGTVDRDGSLTPVEEFTFEGTVGAVAVSDQGTLLVAAAERLLVRSESGTIAAGPLILPSRSGRRLNDGKTDPEGRFFIGSLHLDDAQSTTETLSVVDHDGSVRVIDEDLSLSNGLAWSTDGRTLYSVDTLRRVVYKRAYDCALGTAGPRTVLLTIPEGFPDGLCVDAEDHLWIAIWGIGAVHRYSPDGELVTVIDVPAPHTSSVSFVGSQLDTLIITTATQGLSAEERKQHPGSGWLYSCVPGVRGAPVALWRDDGIFLP